MVRLPMMMKIILLINFFLSIKGFMLCPPSPLVITTRNSGSSLTASSASSDTTPVNPNKYNIPLEKAAQVWTANTQDKKSDIREAGVPFLDSKSRDFFVDDIFGVPVSRNGGLGMELLEIAGGRDDGIGITIVSAVTEGGNAQKADIIPGDSIAAVTVYATSELTGGTGMVEETDSQSIECECRDFDSTIDALSNFPGEEVETVYLDIKRIRRIPKIKVQVEYSPSQCAEGVDNVKVIELYAGENLKRALQNRGIVLDDPPSSKCDYCGSNACSVRIFRGKHLLNPMGTTEEKYMKFNPDCRISCKTTVGYNNQEGELGVRVNLNQWK